MELRSLNEDILATSKRIHALEAEVEALKTEKLARVARLKALETHLNVLRTEQQVIDWSELKNFQEAKERMLLVQLELTKARSEVADKELDYSKEAGKVIKKRVSVGKKQEELDVWKKNLFEMKKQIQILRARLPKQNTDPDLSSDSYYSVKVSPQDYDEEVYTPVDSRGHPTSHRRRIHILNPNLTPSWQNQMKRKLDFVGDNSEFTQPKRIRPR